MPSNPQSPQPWTRTDLLYDLMPHKVREILLVASEYDAFILEKDGHLFERMYNEYQELNLLHVPRIRRVSTASEAQALLSARRIDLVITMANLPDADACSLARRLKEQDPNLAVQLLLNDPSLLQTVRERPGVDLFDGIFFWSGDSAILFAMIKALEDRRNLDPDLATGLVRFIIVIEDSIQYYSELLPAIYGEVLKQTQALISEGLTDLERMMRLRSRPKILHAQSFEQAQQVFTRHHKHLLGVVSDVEFPVQGKLTPDAGIRFGAFSRARIPDLPIILISADKENRARTEAQGLSFVDKNSATFQLDLKDFLIANLGFGDFVFRLPDGTEVARAANFKELQARLAQVPGESLLFHAERNHFSIWLNARGKHEIAGRLKPRTVTSLGGDADSVRAYLIRAIAEQRRGEQKGIVVRYKPGDWDSTMIQLGNGSLGGKARGIAFLEHLLCTSDLRSKFPGVEIQAPQTVFVTTQDFDACRAELPLRALIGSEEDGSVAREFLSSELSPRLQAELTDFLAQVRSPLAVRSSSLLEDSHYLPFAGIYSTYMLPNGEGDLEQRLAQLSRAIRLVYSSVYFRGAKSYLTSTPYKVEDEKMAVVIQRVVGRARGDLFYPDLSGVAQSYNFYPVSYMKPEDGVAQVAMGLGKLVVEGGTALRFCPRYPQLLPQFLTPQDVFRHSQKHFFALDLAADPDLLLLDDGATLRRLSLSKAPKDETLDLLTSVYDLDENVFREDRFARGPRALTFANILKYKAFPLAEILSELLELLRQAMGREIEIEFAVDLQPGEGRPPVFAVLQVRPMAVKRGGVVISPAELSPARRVVYSDRVMGNGSLSGVCDLLYVDPRRFRAEDTRAIAQEVGDLNAALRQEGRPYLLIGPGRWGSTDPWLGAPVTWDQISGARAIVETDTADFYVDPSLGSHFFQNLTAREIGYLSVSVHEPEHALDWDWLRSQTPLQQGQWVTHLRFTDEVPIKIDGRHRQAVVLRPGAALPDEVGGK